jgi:hypothetical protein
MITRTKVIYRYSETGRLITEHEANTRDPSTWTEELITITPVKHEVETFQRYIPTVEHQED